MAAAAQPFQWQVLRVRSTVKDCWFTVHHLLVIDSESDADQSVLAAPLQLPNLHSVMQCRLAGGGSAASATIADGCGRGGGAAIERESSLEWVQGRTVGQVHVQQWRHRAALVSASKTKT